MASPYVLPYEAATVAPQFEHLRTFFFMTNSHPTRPPVKNATIHRKQTKADQKNANVIAGGSIQAVGMPRLSNRNRASINTLKSIPKTEGIKRM
ncbi:MAG: hypothetical protein ABSE82_13905 [Nitrososphaerales archaeon]